MAVRTDPKTFVKDGKERHAYSPSDDVALRFDGWTEKPEEKPSRPTTTRAAETGSKSAS